VAIPKLAAACLDARRSFPYCAALKLMGRGHSTFLAAQIGGSPPPPPAAAAVVMPLGR
jgi:hypothetical protein